MRRLIIALLLLSSPVRATEFLVPDQLPSDGFNGAATVLARAEQIVELVRSTRQIRPANYPDQPWPSDLRVSLVVLHNGASTDVSPVHDLHLALFNLLPEYGTAWALEPVAAVTQFESVQRIEAGIYQISAQRYDPAWECGFVRTKITVDARQLSIAVRQAKGLEEFDDRRYSVAIGRKVETLGCVE